MGLWDTIIGGVPKSWSDQQWEDFKAAYSKIKEGTISWLDYLPPTNLAGLGGKLAGGSIKVALDRGEMGKYASWVESLHEELAAGNKLAAVRGIWVIRLEGKTLETDTELVFVSICALHVAVYGSLDG